MYFVSNQHILMRFRTGKTVTLMFNGIIVDQTPRLLDKLDKPSVRIVASTDVEFGKMFLTLYDCNEKDLSVIVFNRNGQGEKVASFEQRKSSLKDLIKKDPYIN